jgi:hypothetical protein
LSADSEAFDEGVRMGGSTPQHSFSGHETFPFRYLWLKKGFDAVRDNPGAFTRPDATTTLGVGKNMVRSIRHLRMIREARQPTRLLSAHWSRDYSCQKTTPGYTSSEL